MLLLILLATVLIFFLLGALLKWISHKNGNVTDAVAGFVIPLLLFVTLFLCAGDAGPIIFAAAIVGLIIGYRNRAAQSGKSRRKCGPPPQ